MQQRFSPERGPQEPLSFSPQDRPDGSFELPDEIGRLTLQRQDSRNKIVYSDWNLTFAREICAKRPDNSGRDEIQVIFNLNQPIEWQVDAGRETVKMLPGEVCVFRNNDCQTSMHYGSRVQFQFKSLQLATGYFEELLSQYFPARQIDECKALFLTHVTKTAITQDMYRVLSEIGGAEKYQDFKSIFLDAKMRELLALVLYGISHNRTELSPRWKGGIPPAAKADFIRLEKLRQNIQCRPEDDYRAQDLAQRLSMSESKLTRLFRALYGTSLHHYVQEKRLEKAASLLSTGSVNVSEAALKSGYTNMSHFSKEFQKKFGLPPKQFGRQNPGKC